MKRLIVCSLFLVSFCVAQKTENQRYQIIQVEKISEKEIHSLNVSSTSTATAKKTIFLLDTQTGKSWVLSPVQSKVDSNNYYEDYQWIPVSFVPIDKSFDKNVFLPK